MNKASHVLRIGQIFAAGAAILVSSGSARADGPLPPPGRGDRIALIGNGLGERMLYFGHFETELHLRFPQADLVVRNMCRPGDTPGFRPHPSRTSQWAFPGAEKFHPALQQHLGEGFFPTPDEWLSEVKADTIVAFFGYNESFDGPEGADNFRDELAAFVEHTLKQNYNGSTAPRLVLVSPIAFEDVESDRFDLPDGSRENANLEIYTNVMREVAEEHSVAFVDLFHPTLAAYPETEDDFTINGFAPTDFGYRKIALALANGIHGPQARQSKADPESVRKAVLEKDWYWICDYHVLNGVHVYGRRHEPYGPANYPDEIAKTRELTLLHDGRLHEIARGASPSLTVDESKTTDLKPVETNFNQPIDYLGREKALEKFTLREGFEIELFASEAEFPDLKNPVQLSFDAKGRMWVAVTPSYPHWKPGDPRPNDKLLIFEDTDGDGRADRQKVFADNLHLPIGFELAPEGVFVSQEPNLCLLVDEDGDDRADRMEYLLHGFDSHDTHHAISAYCADASGAFYLCEGRFLHSQVETPYGPRRCNDGGVWRFDPKSFRLERYSQSDYNNPWGVTFDEWEQCFISDASNGMSWWALPLSAKMPYGVEIPQVGEFAPKRARPTSGTEFVSSRHFPDELQGHFMICNSIGFLGTSLHEVHEDGAGFAGMHIGDLVSSSDPNFRPVDLEFGPDGSLYIVDWHNALIGHMQHNARDPNRDHDHGRIYRVTFPSRPLVPPARIAGAPIEQLLENLKLPEYRTRYRTRRELRGRPSGEVIPAIRDWAAAIEGSDLESERLVCEALWATWAQNQPDPDLLQRCLSASSHQARAAAVNVLRHAHAKLPLDTVQLFLKAANDPHPRVRLEAIIAASWLDNPAGAQIALEALRHPLDRWMAPVFGLIMEQTLRDDIETLRESGALSTLLADNQNARDFLSGKLKLAVAEASPEAASYGPTRELNAEEMAVYELGKEVFHRDAHCATCHQPNGQGLANIYPPLTHSEWITDDSERLIKIVLKGLWGPIEVAGTTYDPASGVPPMTGFAGLLSDEEIAAVLTYVRASFDNNAPAVTPAEVGEIRAATADRAAFYTVDEILKEHPIKE